MKMGLTLLQHAAASNDNRGPLALVDLGSDRLNVLVCSSKRLWTRSLMLGSDRTNKTLVRQFKLTHGQAEKWKRNPALASSPGRLYESLQPVYEDFFQETLDSLAAFQNAFPSEKIASIIACGGGFATHEPASILSLAEITSTLKSPGQYFKSRSPSADV